MDKYNEKIRELDVRAKKSNDKPWKDLTCEEIER